jgi:cob(I)alamin adenosyltransferase
MKIYTRTGDKGLTGLVDGSRRSKADLRIEALGSIDEANAAIGVVEAQLRLNDATRSWLRRTQSYLFTCGAVVADPEHQTDMMNYLPGEKVIKEYEQHIDLLTRDLPQLRQFILPGGGNQSAATHMARALVRRAERSVIRLRDAGESVDAGCTIYLNRLSDWLFTLARYYSFEYKGEEVPWESRKE